MPQLAQTSTTTNTVAASLSQNTAGLQGFLDNAASLTRITASHRSNLALAIDRLPGLLAQAQPSLQELNTVAVDGTPLVQQIHAAVPSLNRVASDLGPFAAAAKPALAKLSTTLTKATPAIRDATPLIKAVRTTPHSSLPSTELAGKLYTNLQQHGFIESFLSSSTTSRRRPRASTRPPTCSGSRSRLREPAPARHSPPRPSPGAARTSEARRHRHSGARPTGKAPDRGRRTADGGDGHDADGVKLAAGRAPTPSGAPTTQTAPTTTTTPPPGTSDAADPPSRRAPGRARGSLTLQGLLNYLIK